MSSGGAQNRRRSERVGGSARAARLARIQRELDELNAIGRARVLRTYDGVDFSSNDYLGFAGTFGQQPSSAWSGSTGSRSLSGHRREWDELEEFLCEWHRDGADGLATLYFASGYAANEGLLSTLLTADDLVCSDAWNHGSLIDGIRLSRAERCIFPHQDLDALETALVERGPAVRARGGCLYVVTESLFGMDGDRTDLLALSRICERHDALLIVDEAHATGCFGRGGAGLIEELGLRAGVFASVHTCGKALGSHGAYVVVPVEVRRWLIQSCRQFIFSTALPAVVAARTMHAVQRCLESSDARDALREKSEHLRDRLSAGGVAVPATVTDHILPISCGADVRAARSSHELQQEGFRVPAIRFPTVPEGQARLRLSLRADHRTEDLDRLADLLIRQFADPTRA